VLSYRHGFHAGNFADVVKHSILSLLIESLCEKEKGFCYLDTHAGAGCYDLTATFAQKNREFDLGIERVRSRADVPALLNPYLAAIAELNENKSALRWYPGSPRLVRAGLRPQDRMVLTELHSTEVDNLKQEFHGDKQVSVHRQDAYQALKAYLPPRERRGLVLIDPAYELKGELARILEGLKDGWERWPTGMFAVWYPIQDQATRLRVRRQFARSGVKKILCAELGVNSFDMAYRLNGTGMMIVNPPWKLSEQLKQLLPWLTRHLAQQGSGSWSVDWLVTE